MSSIPITSVTITFPRDPTLFVADHNRFLRKANHHAAEYHHQHHIPRHFEKYAGAKYGYESRSKGYLKAKQRKVGHTVDNVYSGATRAEVTKNRTITETPKGAKLKMIIPIKGGAGRILDAAALKRLQKAGLRSSATLTQNQIDGQKKILARIAELEVIDPGEANAISREILNFYTVQANQPGVPKRVRIRG